MSNEAGLPVRLDLAQRVLAVARIAVGWIFLWAFLDKNFGLGNVTPSDQAWSLGTGPDPASAYLAAVDGPFAGLFNPMAGQAWATWLFMLGLLGIGVGLMTGLAFRFSAICGALLLALIYLSALPVVANPFVDDHIVYILLLLGLIPLRNGRVWGLGGWWDRVVGDRVPFLR